MNPGTSHSAWKLTSLVGAHHRGSVANLAEAVGLCLEEVEHPAGHVAAGDHLQAACRVSPAISELSVRKVGCPGGPASGCTAGGADGRYRGAHHRLGDNHVR